MLPAQATTSPALLSPRTRDAVLDVAEPLAWYEVDRAFQDEDFARPLPVLTERPSDSNVLNALVYTATALTALDTSPRSRARRYMDTIDWTNLGRVLAFLHVIEELLWLHDVWTKHNEEIEGLEVERLRRHLNRDGFTIDADGRIQATARVLAGGTLARVRDSRVLALLLKRIERALPDDPMLVIGTAKELVESTCRIVLDEIGLAAPPDAEVPALVSACTQALGVHPKSDPVAGLDGAQEMRRLLGKLVGIPDDLARLRNTTGSGHGRGDLPKGLRPRHAHLALGAAISWCEFVLDVHAEAMAERTTSG